MANGAMAQSTGAAFAAKLLQQRAAATATATIARSRLWLELDAFVAIAERYVASAASRIATDAVRAASDCHEFLLIVEQ